MGIIENTHKIFHKDANKDECVTIYHASYKPPPIQKNGIFMKDKNCHCKEQMEVKEIDKTKIFKHLGIL